MLLDLLIFVAVVGLIVWLLNLLPIPEPFHKIILVIGVIVVVVAVLQALFGVDLVGHFGTRWR
jgi:hypothetical protein